MNAVRLRSIDGGLNRKVLAFRRAVPSNFEAVQKRTVDERLEESALFDAALVPAVLICLRPMTEAQAAAWLADFEL
jgi:hypothetical protein